MPPICPTPNTPCQYPLRCHAETPPNTDARARRPRRAAGRGEGALLRAAGRGGGVGRQSLQAREGAGLGAGAEQRVVASLQQRLAASRAALRGVRS